MTPPRHLPLVAALGATQIIGYGSVYYAYPILAPAVAAEFAVGEPLLFGILSAGLLLGGLAAPALGGLVDRIGAARVMTAGSLSMAGLLTLLAFAPNIYVFCGLILLIELISFAVLYDAAFALLAQKRPLDTRKAITRLTLIAGFASTIFWPLSAFLLDAFGWRATQLIFAAGHLICAALHFGLMALPVAEPVPLDRDATAAPVVVEMTKAVALRAFQLLALGFALTGMAISAMTVHLVAILRSLDIGEAAYLAAMVLGPAQVAVRLMDATVWRDRHPLAIALLSAAAIATAILLLLPGAPPALAPLLALTFAAILGAGAGLSSIVRGAVPVALFGASGLGLRLGRLAAIRNLLGAAAPFLFASAAAYSMAWALAAALCTALAGLLALLLLQRDLQRAGVVPPLRSVR